MAVAQSGIEIVSLAEMKAELGLPSTVTSRDITITGNIEAAASYIAELTGLPIVQQRAVWIAPRFPNDDQPVDLPYTRVTAIDSLRYWQRSDSLLGLPGGSIDPSDLGAIRPYRADTHDGFWLYAPSGGWPDAHDDRTDVAIAVDLGIDPVPAALKQAIILAARDFFEGQRQRPANDAIEILARPFIRTAHPDALERNRRAALGLGHPGADAFESSGASVPDTPVGPSMPPGPPTPSGPTTRYFGMALSDTITTADFASANTSQNNDGNFPAHPSENRYPWIGVPEALGAPTEFYRPPNPFNQIASMPRQAGTVDDGNGNNYIVIVSHALSPASSRERAARIAF